MISRSGRSIVGIMPVCIWLSAVAGVGLLYTQRVRTISVQGLSFAVAQPVVPVENGIVRQLPVELFQAVEKGDVLAIVDLGSPLQNDYAQALAEAQRATARAELDKLRAELDAAAAQLEYENRIRQNEQFADYRQFILDVERARLEILQTRAMLEPGRIELFGLELEKNAMKSLLDKQAVQNYEYEMARYAYETAAARVAAQERLLEEAEKNFSVAEERLAEFAQIVPEKDLIDTIMEPYAKAVAVQERLLGELFTPVFRMPLRAPFDGIVSEILVTEGQGFSAGLPLLTISRPQAEYVLAWVDQNRASAVVPNQPVKIVKQSHPRKVLHTQVTAVSPVVELLPERLWDSPTIPKWGRAVRIQLPADALLAGNEVVGISGI